MGLKKRDHYDVSYPWGNGLIALMLMQRTIISVMCVWILSVFHGPRTLNHDKFTTILYILHFILLKTLF